MNLFQRIAHRLFGWHYLRLRFGNMSYDTKICRVRFMPNGRPYVLFLDSACFLDEVASKSTPLTWTEPRRPELKVAA